MMVIISLTLMMSWCNKKTCVMTDKQKSIIGFALKNGDKITKKEAVQLIGSCYYCNASKHVGDVLSRMVKAGLLERVKAGTFIIGKNRRQTAQGVVNPNQLNLL